MDLTFSRSTDTKHKVTLESAIAFADWQQVYAPAGQKVRFLIGTVFVGDGAPLEVKGRSQKGKSLGKVTGKVLGSTFTGVLTVPSDTKIGDEVFFEVKIPKNGLSAQSNRIAVVPPVEVTQLTWGAAEARRGDILTLSASVSGLKDGVDGTVTIYEYDRDGSHDKIVQLPVTVKDSRIELHWEYEYHEDTDEIPTQAEMSTYGRNYNPPEYFFTVRFYGEEFGKRQESGLLAFRDWVEFRFKDVEGCVLPDQEYEVTLPDGTRISGRADGDGRARIESVPPGSIQVQLKAPSSAGGSPQ